MNDTMETPKNEIIEQLINNYIITKTDLQSYEKNLKETITEYMGLGESECEVGIEETSIDICFYGGMVQHETLQKIMKLPFKVNLCFFDSELKFELDTSGV